MIEAKNLYKKFIMGKVEVPVLNGIDLKVEMGEYVLITGRSGAGKSTLLYLLGLLDEPTRGEIVVDGINVASYSEKMKGAFRLLNLAYVFQDYALLPELTASDNVAVPLLMRGLERGDVEERSKNALEQVNLGEKLEYLPSQLSGGQQQRVSIARAIALKPKILFADEPTANLDTKTAETVMEVFRNINKNGQTIVMVTHEIKKAKGSSRIINLLDGKIEH